MNDVLAAMEKAALENVVIPTDKQLYSLSESVLEMLKQKDYVENLEKELKKEKAELSRLEELEIPDKMLELNLKSWETTDGTKITCAPFVYAFISKEHKDKAYQWLKDNGFSDLIKHHVSVDVGRDEELAHAVVETLESMGVLPKETEAVHHATLKAFAGEQIRAGQHIPVDLFGVHLGHRATIKKG